MLTNAIQESMSGKKRLSSRLAKNAGPSPKTTGESFKREISQKINDQIIQAWTKKVSKLDTDNMSEHNGTTYNSPEEKATIFAEVLENSFHPHGDLYDRQIHDKITQDTTTYLQKMDLNNNDAPQVLPVFTR
ncbi:hypothetical protein ANN_19410 [Periplaneta americana]|uniref:Uncharacterized protein n=1 Tax=Periplaneta americana TaxID=6978 RepID=A0ABQ8SAD0_PERAM|nr:hypothetical protein ANN_19410 [Periplaneta americana]